MNQITLPQALVLIVCIIAPVVATKFLGSELAGGAIMTAGMIVNFLLGRGTSEK